MLTDEQVERMVKDAGFVGGKHVYAPVMHDDLCCHIRALASEREALLQRLSVACDGLGNAVLAVQKALRYIEASRADESKRGAKLIADLKSVIAEWSKVE